MTEQQATVERTPKVFHPLLLAVFPPLSFFAKNISELTIDFLFYPVLISVGATALLWGLLTLVAKDRYKSAVLASLFVLLFFSYGHLANEMQAVPYRHKILMTLCLAAFTGCFYLVRKTARKIDRLTLFLNLMALFLVLFPVVSNYGNFHLKVKYYFGTVERPKSESPDTKVKNADGSGTPDIYYFIFDRYAPQQTFKDLYQYDNSGFLDFLKSSGFVIAPKSLSNYPYTPLSLASSLNMRYLDFLSAQEGARANDFSVVREMMQNSEVLRFVKERGYKYFHVGMKWGPYITNRFADRNINYANDSESYEMFLETTVLDPVITILWGKSKRDAKRAYIRYQYEQLAKMAKEPGPKFVFAHLGTTHPEFLFGPNGEPVSGEAENKDGIKAYLDTVKFHNQKIGKILSGLLKDSPKPPIILLQSDEGPYWPSAQIFEKNGGFETKDANALKARCRIFNAYYLPGEPQAPPPDDITPINTFRYVFSRYFKANLPPLPNECYVPGPPGTPFKFRKVTDIVRYPEDK